MAIFLVWQWQRSLRPFDNANYKILHSVLASDSELLLPSVVHYMYIPKSHITLKNGAN